MGLYFRLALNWPSKPTGGANAASDSECDRSNTSAFRLLTEAICGAQRRKRAEVILLSEKFGLCIYNCAKKNQYLHGKTQAREISIDETGIPLRAINHCKLDS
jgi:hypothetical protein